MTYEHCLHSVLVNDCNSCLWGYIERQETYIERLRDMIDKKALAIHDAYWFESNKETEEN